MRREGGPWVAHRVWAMPQCESKTFVRSGLVSSMSAFSLATLPTSLKASTSFFLSPSIARPAESYPRYSRRERPWQIVSWMPGYERERRGEKWGRKRWEKAASETQWLSRRGGKGEGGEARSLIRTVDECVDDEFPILFHQVVDVAENTTGRSLVSDAAMEDSDTGQPSLLCRNGEARETLREKNGARR